MINITVAEGGIQGIPGTSGGSASYKIYRALLSQSGTASPVAAVLENTLGGDVTFDRTLAGSFRALSSSLFGVSADKCFVLMGAFGAVAYTAWASAGEVGFSTLNDYNDSGTDGWLANTSFEILVYP